MNVGIELDEEMRVVVMKERYKNVGLGERKMTVCVCVCGGWFSFC